MINVDTIYNLLLTKIMVEYEEDGYTHSVGAGYRINDIHPLLTKKAISDLADADQPYEESITDFYKAQLKSFVHELYSKIKWKGQTVEVLESCDLFTRSKYDTDDTARNLMIKPRLGTLTINRLELNSDADTTAALKIIDLKDNSETDSVLTINKYLSEDVNLSSKFGFIISITPVGEVYRWYNTKLNSNYTIIGENSDISTVDRYKDEYFSYPSYFLANVHLNVECDITQWFVDNIDSVVPFLAHKLALAWLKLIYYNGNTRGNLTENNPKVNQAYVEIFGDVNAKSGLIYTVEELESTAISKYGYGDPCFKWRTGKIRYDGI